MAAGRQRAGFAAGLVLCAGMMMLAWPLADALGAAVLRAQGISPLGRGSPISGAIVVIVAGMLLRNLVRFPASVLSGIQFSVARVLRLGIVLVGIKLSLLDVFRLGAWGIPVVVVAVLVGLGLITWFNRALKLPARLGALIAVGTGICGVTAIVSTAPAIDADEQEVAYAVANITLFGLIGMFVYPYAAAHLFSTPEQVGLFLGTAVHETAQVVGAALTYREVFGSDTALKAATVTKLTRNLLLAVVVPLMSWFYLRSQSQSPSRNRPDLKKLVPAFILGFVAMTILRSAGDWSLLSSGRALALLDRGQWERVVAIVGDQLGSHYLLGTAMAGIGLSMNFAVFKGVGLKPFAVGLAGALLVGATGMLMTLWLGRFVHL